MQVEILGALRTAGTGDPMRSCRDDVERALRCAKGREIGRTATGLVAVFERPSRAIRCAVELRDRMKQAGLDMRAAIHIGECEKRGDDVSGLAIQLTASLLGHAKPGDILASRTVRELEAGSNLAFDPGGEVELPGSAGHWPFFSVGGPVGRREPP